MGKTCSVEAPVTSVNGITINKSKPCNSSNYTKVGSRNIDYIVMHYTGNKKDTASNNANYFMGANRKASSHYFVDDTSIWQSVDVNDRAWHCGTDGTYYHKECRNTNSIGIEMCCTAGSYKIGADTLENAAQLAASLCKYLGITDVDKYVVRHYDVTHKKCPAQMAGKNNEQWEAFKSRVKEILNPVMEKLETDGFADYEVGQVVNFIGKKHYSNPKSSIGSSCTKGEAKITATSKGSKHPYHLIKTSGSSSTVYGWVNVSDIEEKKNTATVKKDTKIDTVKEVQKWLNDSYSAKLAEDGIYGSKTKSALIKVLQKAIGVTADGVYGSKTNKAIKVLKKGSTGNAVRALQGLLVCNGYTSAYVDGSYGSGVVSAVKSYQKKKKLTVDGKAGKETFSSLCK